MKIRTFRHYLGAALNNLFLNRLMTIASILTVASCIFIVSLFYLLVVNVNSVITHMQDQVGLVVFIDDDAPVELTVIWDRIMAIPNVRMVEYIPPEANEDVLVDMFGEGSPLLDAMRLNNPFGHAFSVDIYNIQFHDDVVAALDALRPYGIDSIRQEQDLANTLWNLTRMVQAVSIIVIFILGLISIVIIINTIRITVSSRQAEINIMKYVGATDWFIRWPFIIEGVIIGLLGAAIPAIVCVIWYDSIIQRMTDIQWLDFMYFLPGSAVLFYVVPLALALGAFIGLFGSAVSIRQYLKV